MHPAAADFIRVQSHTINWLGVIVYEVGAFNVNGRARDFVPSGWLSWTGFDLLAGPEVDVVGDAAETLYDYTPCDVLVSAEVLEHAENWKALVKAMCDSVAPGGYVILTCAGPGRWPHSACQEGPPMAGEYYCNVGADELEAEFKKHGFQTIVSELVSGDTRYFGKNTVA